ncbi:MAG TPA: nitroreductase family protein [Acidimicrobiia bacterium]
MTDLYEGILTTRAIRRFTAEPIGEEDVKACLRAAMQAPSGGNAQPWQFVVVTDPELMQAIAAVYLAAYDRWEGAQLASLPPFRSEEDEAGYRRSLRASRYLAEHLTDAAALVLFLMPQIDLAVSDQRGRIDIGPLYASVYPAVQNFMLAARSMGIGTALTTVYWSRQDELRTLCQIPDRFEVVALVPMGHPRGKFGIAPRKPPEAVTHWDRYGNRR